MRRRTGICGTGRALAGAVLSLALLGGCASVGGARPGGVTARVSDDAVGTVGADVVAAEGERFRVVGTYVAASGKTCRRLADASGAVLVRVSCRQSDGDWTLGRSFDGGNPAGSPSSRVRPVAAGPETGASVPVVLASSPEAGGEMVGEALRRDETLWRFAARVTGDPRNWSLIAGLNGIDDVTSIESGRTLQVPLALTSAVR